MDQYNKRKLETASTMHMLASREQDVWEHHVDFSHALLDQDQYNTILHYTGGAS